MTATIPTKEEKMIDKLLAENNALRQELSNIIDALDKLRVSAAKAYGRNFWE